MWAGAHEHGATGRQLGTLHSPGLSGLLVPAKLSQGGSKASWEGGLIPFSPQNSESNSGAEWCREADEQDIKEAAQEATS